MENENNENNLNIQNQFFFNPILIFILLFVICIFLYFSFYLGNKENQYSDVDNNNSSTNIFGIFLISLLVLLIVVNFFQYLLGINIVSSVKDIFTNNPKIDIDVYENTPSKETVNPPISSPDPSPSFEKPQVFNIPENIYNYEDAKAVCSAFNSKLATYDQIEEYYKNDGEFCNYGWSEGQLALFPTQKATYNKLSKTKNHKNDCGRPGINGGFISNPLVRFGANCYGYKPLMTPDEEEIMASTPIYPITKKDIEFEKRIEYWKGKLQDIIVSPFNKNKWNEMQ
jgi:hypothetical protein